MAKDKDKSKWYKSGNAGRKQATREDEEAKQRRAARGPMRFWLDNNTSAKVTFLRSD